jgi:hypothetical protein
MIIPNRESHELKYLLFDFPLWFTWLFLLYFSLAAAITTVAATGFTADF